MPNSGFGQSKFTSTFLKSLKKKLLLPNVWAIWGRFGVICCCMRVRKVVFQESPPVNEFFAITSASLRVLYRFWPEAEDKALRGRNLSAVFRTLYRQVGGRCRTFPSCAHTWRVENPCDKSTVRTAHRLGMARAHPKRISPAPRWQATCRSVSSSADIPRRANHRLVVESPGFWY